MEPGKLGDRSLCPEIEKLQRRSLYFILEFDNAFVGKINFGAGHVPFHALLYSGYFKVVLFTELQVLKTI